MAKCPPDQPANPRDFGNLGDTKNPTDQLIKVPQCSKIVLGDGRTCTKCNRWKHWSEFGKRKSGKNGYSSICKPCRVTQDHRNKNNEERKVCTFEGRGINIEFELEPTDRFWKGLDYILNIFLDDEVRRIENAVKKELE